MDIVERLTLEAAQADTMIACEHRQRYEFAAGLSGGLRVLDLGCGSGYGAQIVAAQAASVVGIDNDIATIDTARARLGPSVANISFEAADARSFLDRGLADEFDVIVCFETLEHLPDLHRTLELLRARAQQGVRLVVSVPNGKLFGEQNPFHVTEFGFDDAIAAFSSFPATVMVPQYLAEGSVICPASAQAVEVSLSLEGRDEPEYANHFIFCVNFGAAEAERVYHGRMQLAASPVFNRWSEDLKRGAWALRRENARLARARLGKGGSAAGSALSRLAGHAAELAAIEGRCHAAEARVAELEALLADRTAGWDHDEKPGARQADASTTSVSTGGGRVRTCVATPPTLAEGEDPNSWEQRRVRAAGVLVPWIEQTIPLAGKTVLEYGCGNAAVSCAVAERAGSLIGVDIDPDGLELGRRKIDERCLTNVELELHPVNSILEALARRRGTIDVLLLYAVLEHLTLDERLALLRLAREVVKPGGAIVVCETPNRLIYFDHHTAQMPFFHLLPDQLAADYYPRSERRDFKAAMEAAETLGRDALLERIARWGRGVSFHEFELVFDDLNRHVLASSYDPLLFGERPVHPDEVVLARYLDRCRPDLAPAWSRYWLDLILTPQPVVRRPPMLRPWTADTGSSAGVSWTRWENLLLHGPEAKLGVDLPHPTSRLVVGTVAEPGPLRLQAGTDQPQAVLAADIPAAAPHATYTTFSLPGPSQRVTLAASRACHVVFVGYED